MIVYRLLSAAALLHLANAQNNGGGGGGGGGGNDSGGDPTKGPIDTCLEQNNCFDVTVTALSENQPCGLVGECFFEACIEVNLSKTGCGKTDDVSHSCDKSDGNKCPLSMTTSGNTLWDVDEAEGVPDGTKQCQIGVGGTPLQFIYKDGGTCEAADSAAAGTIIISGTGANGASATCRASEASDFTNNGETQTCSGNAAGLECVWVVTLPQCPVCTLADCDAIRPVLTVDGSGNANTCSVACDALQCCEDCPQDLEPALAVAASLPTSEICLADGTLFELDVENVPTGFTVDTLAAAILIPGNQVSIGITLTSDNGGTCPYTIEFTPDCVCANIEECNPSETGLVCCPTTSRCDEPDTIGTSACGDPHMTGFLGQKFDFTGEDGQWYALVADANLNVNMRVTSPVADLPQITYITGLSILATDADGFDHSIVIEVRDPHSLESSCPAGLSPCLADGALRVVLDETEDLLTPGTVSLGQGVHVSAVNLPGACRSFGFEKYWERKVLENSHHGRRMGELIGAGEWVLADPTATNMKECIEYVMRAELAEGGLFDHQSEHASFQIVTPKATIRLSHGRLHQVAMRDPTDQFDLPDHLTWQMNIAIDHNEVSRAAKGVLGETVVPTRDSDGMPIMAGMEAIRGQHEDYLVDGPLGTDFVQDAHAS